MPATPAATPTQRREPTALTAEIEALEDALDDLTRARTNLKRYRPTSLRSLHYIREGMKAVRRFQDIRLVELAEMGAAWRPQQHLLRQHARELLGNTYPFVQCPIHPPAPGYLFCRDPYLDTRCVAPASIHEVGLQLCSQHHGTKDVFLVCPECMKAMLPPPPPPRPRLTAAEVSRRGVAARQKKRQEARNALHRA